MLFNSYGFILVFLPVAFIGFFWLGRRFTHPVALTWLVWMSLVFYGWWNPAYLVIIFFSLLFNYAIGIQLDSQRRQRKPGNRILALGVAVNLVLLGYYKYAGFLTENLNTVLGTQWPRPEILLPLAISFFTFQQIAYLVDTHRGVTHQYKFLQYCLFVTFFPQFVAGPIVHHKEILPQFSRPEIYRIQPRMISMGTAFFFVGLFKKVVIADEAALYASPLFSAAAGGMDLTLAEAWLAGLSYTFQLYFDFSGYSDMAVGLGMLFGIRLPLNFHSPYKAGSIIEFWRRWHITLSRFLRDYLYFALGGNRKGSARRYLNLVATMLLGGLWHGAGWTYVVWGGLHGFMLALNHGWRYMKTRLDIVQDKTVSQPSSGVLSPLPVARMGSALGVGLTFGLVVVGWVFFRAPNLPTAFSIVGSMGMVDQTHLAHHHGVISLNTGYNFVAALLAVVWLLPNTQQIMGRYFHPLPVDVPLTKESPPTKLLWRPSPLWALGVAILAGMGILGLSRVSEFIYFQF
ncbi:MAG: MBOAT family protein [Deltaproteobacteria bacterium]|nr:MBOAT family protein [Deltaproteobacteria bacterium]